MNKSYMMYTPGYSEDIQNIQPWGGTKGMKTHSHEECSD